MGMGGVGLRPHQVRKVRTLLHQHVKRLDSRLLYHGVQSGKLFAHRLQHAMVHH